MARCSKTASKIFIATFNEPISCGRILELVGHQKNEEIDHLKSETSVIIPIEFD